MPAAIAVAPESEADWMSEAVRAAGGRVVPLDAAEGLIWCGDAASLRPVLAQAPKLAWIQLPAAGIETYLSLMDDGAIVWTAAKGVYADTCAEQALGLAIAGFRHLDVGARRQSWSPLPGKSLFSANVTIIGAGGIAHSLLRLLQPFHVRTTVVRHRPEPVAEANATLPLDHLDESLADADLVVLAAALTSRTNGMIAEHQLRAMKGDAWLVNVARGRLVKTQDLVRALEEHWIGGAGLDVTDPEPLPDGHPLWRLDNCIITSHTANPANLEREQYRVRIVDNVRRFVNGEPLLGAVDHQAGY